MGQGSGWVRPLGEIKAPRTQQSSAGSGAAAVGGGLCSQHSLRDVHEAEEGLVGCHTHVGKEEEMEDTWK